jgi:hypothetical protein
VDMVETGNSVPDDKQIDLTDSGIAMVIAIANNATNKSYLQGIANFVEMLHQPDRNAGRFVRGFVSSFVPNVARDVANLKSTLIDGDETMKEIRSTVDAIMAKTPGLSDNLEKKRNALGEPIKRITALGTDSVSPWLDPLVPISSRSGKDFLLREMANLDYGFSSPSSRRNGYDMVDIKSASGQSAYDRWLENSSTLKIGGKTLRKSLEEVISSPRYQELSKFSQTGDPSPRTQAVKTLIDRYRRSAFTQTLREIPELNNMEKAYLTNQAAQRAGIRL